MTIVKSPPQANGKTLGLIIVTFVFTAFFWNSPFIYPVKIFTVLLHEISHGLAAVLTGGSLVRIELSPGLGGVAYTDGGSRVAILTAGYLGSCIFGGLIMVAAARTNYDKAISVSIGAAVLAIALFFVRSAFGFVYCFEFSVVMVAVGLRASEKVNDALLMFIGLNCSLYAIIDIKEDLIARTIPCSDAYRLSEIIPLPSFLIGMAWMAASAAFTYYMIKLSVAPPEAGTGTPAPSKNFIDEVK